MSWQPPQIPSGGLVPPSSPVSSQPRRRSRLLPIAVVVGLAIGGGVIVANRDDDNGGIFSEDTRASGDGPGATESTGLIGPDGGVIALPDSDAIGGGITLAVPAGALSADTQLTISASPGRSGDVLALANESVDVWSALANYALDDEDTLVHPVFGPLVLASFTEFTGPVINLGPDALYLAQPAEVTVPLALLDFPEGTEPVVLLESVTGWEVIDGATIDATNGVLRFHVPHFSRSFIGRIFSNVWYNPSATTSPGQYAEALETLSAGPAEAVTDGVMRALLCNTTPSFNAAALPDASTLLEYLGFESVQVGQAPAGARGRIRDVLQAHFAASGGTSTTGPRDFSLEVLLQLAMTETGGDPFQSLVLAHDVLRDSRNLPSVQNVMENVRGDNGDERGARYHLLGTAIYSFAYEHFRATQQTGTFWPPRPESVVTIEEAWVSGDIRSDTVEYAVDRLGARMGRDLYRQFSAVASGEQSEEVELLCASTTTSSTSTSTVPPDVVLGTGDVQVTLLWSGDSDMDLHVVEPNGEETYFSSKESSTGGSLDHDEIPSCGSGTGSHVENIFWPVDLAPPGEYIDYVDFYNACAEGVSQSVQLTVRVNGQVVISEAITLVEDGQSDAYRFNVS